MQAPVVTAFDFTPKTIDLSTGHTTVEFTVTITDDISGVSGSPYVFLRGPDGNGFGVWLGRTAGDELDGTYSGSLVVSNPYTANGIWLVEYLPLIDLANNSSTIATPDFIAAGWPTELTITTGEVPYDVVAFGAPIDNGVTNVARAGRTTPVKWYVSLSGALVSDPAHFVSVTSAPAAAGETTLGTDVIEVYSGQSGLQYLGDGWWQFNWKVPKAYAGLTRVMTPEAEVALRAVATQFAATRVDLERIAGSLHESPVPFVRDFASEVRCLLKGRTFDTYRHHLDRLVREFGDRRLDEVSLLDLERAAVGVREDALRRPDAVHGFGAQESFVNATRFMFVCAIKTGHLRSNPAAGLSRPRREGILNARIGDLHPAPSIVLYEKFDEQREIPLSPQLAAALRTHADDRSPDSHRAFHYRNGTPLTERRYDGCGDFTDVGLRVGARH